MEKRSWGKSEMKFCPERKKVWQIYYNTSSNANELVLYNDIPTYGLERVKAPIDLKETTM